MFFAWCIPTSPFIQLNSFCICTLQVCENGLLSFEKQYCGEPAEKTSTTPPIIAGFWSVINNQGGCHISYGEITNSSPISNLQRSKPQVEHLLHKGFNDTFDPTHIFVATWYHVNGNDTQDNVSLNLLCDIIIYLI